MTNRAYKTWKSKRIFCIDESCHTPHSKRNLCLTVLILATTKALEKAHPFKRSRGLLPYSAAVREWPAGVAGPELGITLCSAVVSIFTVPVFNLSLYCFN